MMSVALGISIDGCETGEDVFARLRGSIEEQMPAGKAREALLAQIGELERDCAGMSPLQISGLTLMKGLLMQWQELDSLHDGAIGAASQAGKRGAGARQLFLMGGAAGAIAMARAGLHAAAEQLSTALGVPMPSMGGDTEGEA